MNVKIFIGSFSLKYHLSRHKCPTIMWHDKIPFKITTITTINNNNSFESIYLLNWTCLMNTVRYKRLLSTSQCHTDDLIVCHYEWCNDHQWQNRWQIINLLIRMNRSGNHQEKLLILLVISNERRETEWNVKNHKCLSEPKGMNDDNSERTSDN